MVIRSPGSLAMRQVSLFRVGQAGGIRGLRYLAGYSGREQQRGVDGKYGTGDKYAGQRAIPVCSKRLRDLLLVRRAPGDGGTGSLLSRSPSRNNGMEDPEHGIAHQFVGGRLRYHFFL